MAREARSDGPVDKGKAILNSSRQLALMRLVHQGVLTAPGLCHRHTPLRHGADHAWFDCVHRIPSRAAAVVQRRQSPDAPPAAWPTRDMPSKKGLQEQP
ncbi:MAG: hypothetical protein WD928_01530 [Gammaproteobacteria bacterium]